MIVLRLVGQWILLGLSAYGVYQAYLWDPVFGFALVSAAIAFAISVVLEFRRFLVERRFFFGPESARLTAPIISVISAVNALGRALVVGAAALFTFPAPGVFEDLAEIPMPDGLRDSYWVYKNNLILDYVAQLRVDTLWTFYILAGLVFLGLIISFVVDGLTSGRGHRWSLFQLAGVFGILFSLTVVSIRIESADEKNLTFENKAVFKSPTTEQVSLFFDRSAGFIYDPLEKIGALDLCKRLAEKDRRGNWRAPRSNLRIKTIELAGGVDVPEPFEVFGMNSCAYRLKSEEAYEGYADYCSKSNNLWRKSPWEKDNPLGPAEFDDEKWQGHGCASPKNDLEGNQFAKTITGEDVPPTELVRRLLIGTSVIDGFIDDQINAGIDLLLDDDWPFAGVITFLARVLISAKLLQGLVISVYVTFVVLLLTPRRVH